MATVKQGGKASSDEAASPSQKAASKPAAPSKDDPADAKAVEASESAGDADRMREAVTEEDTTVAFESDCSGHIWLDPPRPQYIDGQQIGLTKGLFLDFEGVGRTKSYDPDGNGEHREYVDAVLKQIERKHPDVVRFNIRLAEKHKAPQPATRWNVMNAGSLRGFVEAKLTENHDANVAFVKECARYEVENKNRKDVLAMLDTVLVTEASLSDAFEAEVRLD